MKTFLGRQRKSFDYYFSMISGFIERYHIEGVLKIILGFILLRVFMSVFSDFVLGLQTFYWDYRKTHDAETTWIVLFSLYMIGAWTMGGLHLFFGINDRE